LQTFAFYSTCLSGMLCIVCSGGILLAMSNVNSSSNNRNGKIQNDYWIWLTVYLGIGLAISFIVPFPISFIVAVIIFVLINAVRTDIALRRRGIHGLRGLYRSVSSSSRSSNNNGIFGAGFGYSPLRFNCMKCGFEHRKSVCPKCGSKAVKAG
jgi:hypothetical protein